VLSRHRASGHRRGLERIHQRTKAANNELNDLVAASGSTLMT
jgi:hypothetical protein